jgi:hypothetical protein
MNRSVRRAMLAAALLLAAACATQSAGAPATRHNLVTAEQLDRAGNVNLYDALRTLRPNFLRTRAPAQGASAEVPIKVFIGGMQMIDGMDHLRQLMARAVQEVEFLEPHQANTRFGGNNSGGALVIVLKP